MTSGGDSQRRARRLLWTTLGLAAFGWATYRLCDGRPRSLEEAEAKVLASISTFQEFAVVFPDTTVRVEHFSWPGDIKRAHATKEEIEDRYTITVVQRCRFNFDGSVVAESDPQFVVVDRGVRDPTIPYLRRAPQNTTAYIGLHTWRSLVESGFDWAVVGLGR